MKQALLYRICVLFALTMVSGIGIAEAQVFYIVHGRVNAVHQSTSDVESTSTSAISGVEAIEADPLEPVPAGAERRDSRTPLPGVIIEAYEVSTGHMLGSGVANFSGFFRIEYMHTLVNHEVIFRVFLDPANGGKEYFGESEVKLVDSQIFALELDVFSEESFRFGESSFSTAGQFVFVEVGDVDMDNIYDEQQDPTESDRWGMTKQTATGGFDAPFNGHRLSADLAFGGRLELYGLFEEGTPTAPAPRYYRISYTGPASGTITTELYKKNFVIAGTSIETFREKLGPQTVGSESNLYRIDEFMTGTAIGTTGYVYSNFWTELGLRAVWHTHGLPDGLYTLEIERFDGAGNLIAPPGDPNNFANLNLYLVNETDLSSKITSKIHSLHYLSPSEEPPVLSDSAPCQTVVLNPISAATDDDSLQFKITAEHAGGFLREYQLYAWHGHNTADGVISSATYPLTFPLAAVGPHEDFVVTPSSINYQSCAYRFHLRVWPRITNGYHIIYVRDDNWYASINVLTP